MTDVIGTIDVAQVVLYAFWIFFFGLIFYLRREDRREGYPLVAEDGVEENPGVVWMPTPKKFVSEHGDVVYVPRDEAPQVNVNGTPIDPWGGAPLTPNGDPMLAAIGPGAYANRANVPDIYDQGQPRIAPLRAAADFFLDDRDSDPRGMSVIGADGKAAGTISDIWVDRAEFLIRYLEVQLPGGKTVLLPQTFADINGRRGVVEVNAILAHQFANVPELQTPDIVTLREEDKICAYYGGGYLYATPQRAEPLI